MRFDAPDAAPSDALNRILWHDARGWSTPYPRVRQSLFFPMSRDIDDDEREAGSGKREAGSGKREAGSGKGPRISGRSNH